MRALLPVLVLCLTHVRSQPRGPPGLPPQEPGSQPIDGPGQGPRPFDAPGLGPQDSPSQGKEGPQPQPFEGPLNGPPSGPSATQGQQSSNPWQDLLNKMVDLLSTGGGPKNLSKVPAEIFDPKQGPGSGPDMGPAPGDLPPPPKPLPENKPVIKDCFWEGQYYSPGSDIVRGQHDRWCYVTYCDSQGKIQFWDDYNCKPNSMKDTSSHSSGRDRWIPPGQRTGGGPQSKTAGCQHNGQWYAPDQDISSHRVGDRCYGSYCSQDSQVISWEDYCVNVNNVGATPSPGNTGPTGGMQQQGGGQQGRGQRRGQGRGQGQGLGQGQGGRRRAKPSMGCYHGGQYYKPNDDVVVGTIGDLCYGYYCEGDNVFVHWEDSCQNQNIQQGGVVTQAPPVQQTSQSWWGF